MGCGLGPWTSLLACHFRPKRVGDAPSTTPWGACRQLHLRAANSEVTEERERRDFMNLREQGNCQSLPISQCTTCKWKKAQPSQNGIRLENHLFRAMHKPRISTALLLRRFVIMATMSITKLAVTLSSLQCQSHRKRRLRKCKRQLKRGREYRNTINDRRIGPGTTRATGP